MVHEIYLNIALETHEDQVYEKVKMNNYQEARKRAKVQPALPQINLHNQRYFTDAPPLTQT